MDIVLDVLENSHLRWRRNFVRGQSSLQSFLQSSAILRISNAFSNHSTKVYSEFSIALQSRGATFI